jgi:hypothetical protein
MTVNCFIFVSGYYGIRLKIKTVVTLFVQAFMYSILLNIFYDYFFASVNLDTFVSSLFPVFKSHWWFITTYIVLYMLSPFLNMAKQQLSKFQFLYVLGILTIVNSFVGLISSAPNLGINNGYSVMSFVTVYFYGHAFKKYFKFNKGKSIFIITYVLSCSIIFLLFIAGLKYLGPKYAYKAFAYNNPLVLISAISFFFIFKESKIKSNMVLKFSPVVLGVYLIHDHKRVRILLGQVYDKLELYSFNIYVSLLTLSLVVFIVAGFIEWNRSRLADPLIRLILDKFNLKDLEDRINLVGTQDGTLSTAVPESVGGTQTSVDVSPCRTYNAAKGKAMD